MGARQLKIGSLFSGSGMLDLAVAEFFGGELRWQAERDRHASAVLAARFPGVPNLGDVSGIKWGEVDQVDVICGGFPCQDVSTAGLRAGLAPGTRSGTWLHMAEAIRAIRPSYVVIENVRGLRSAKAHRPTDLESGDCCLADESVTHLRALGAVLGDLAALGYDAKWGSVRAADAGAPHQRERVFVLAYPADASGKRHGRGQDGERLGRMDGSNARQAQQRQRSRQEPGDRNATPTADTASPQQREATVPELRNELGASPRGGSDDAGTTDFGVYAAAVRRWEQRLGTPAPAPTEPGQSGPRLSPEFVEWMMGWPLGWTDAGISRTQRLKVCGNGVVPQQVMLALSLLMWEVA